MEAPEKVYIDAFGSGFSHGWHTEHSCEGGDSIKDFTGDTVEEAINKACNWFHSTFCNS